MKTVLFILLAVQLTFAQSYQKQHEKKLNYNGESITLDVSFAHKISVETWDKNEVFLTADIAMKKEEHLPLYKLSTEQKSNTILIQENTKAYFKTLRKERIAEKVVSWRNDEYEFNYVLYVPRNATTVIKSINGGLKVNKYKGNLETDLINGNIDINNYQGAFDLSTINGEIDLKVANNPFEAKTINGDIYADEELRFEAYSKHVGHHIKSKTAGGKATLNLNTINGNMYLR